MANESAGQIGSAAVTALGNYAVGVAANKRQYKYQLRAMAQQQAYNRELWDYQNAYNTPQQQMERLKAAGLNPRLIYGSGSGTAAGNAGPIAPTDVPSQEAARPNLPDFLSRYYELRQADAQYRATLQTIENAKIKANLDQTKVGLENLKLMRENMRKENYESLAHAEKMTRLWIMGKTEQQFYGEQHKNRLMGQLHDYRDQSNPLQISAQRLENEFRQNRNELAKYGVYSSDHALLRIFIQASHRMGIDLGELLTAGKDKLSYLMDLAR